MDQSFKKQERLCHKKVIDSLFDRSNALNKSKAEFPVRMIYRKAEDAGRSQVLFSVSKRAFKRAVDRNAMKRRLREAYRLNKHEIVDKPSYIVFLYLSKEKMSFADIQKAMQKLLSKIK
ncbi:ribonuclease P protein component [Marinilongibacter aquaticus]|uniref:ribonuclease P protein component n=1 Tax=Marinilongibacter aquaticus TaxID=2975157 RepID=UPI0021BD88CE|nr:ribonuclease P protein component [Marinilongibacter aquaticus]UBM58318.1 ribonuclease P protein component [Marinilongibacter aquaticus]